MARRLVVIGADGAGMSAAHQALRTARRLGRDLEVVAVEMSRHTSYSACGLPYWVAGDVGSADALVARSADEHRRAGIDLRMRTEAIGLDLDAGAVTVRGPDGEQRIGFDDVLLATGAQELRPDWASGVPGVLPLRTLDDGAAWRSLLEGVTGVRPRRALVVGGGYIGVEAAESFARRGLVTTLATRGAEPLSSSLDPSMGALVRQALEKSGITVVTGTEVDGLDRRPGGQVSAACLGGEEHAVDVVAVAIGVRPRVGLAAAAGLAVGKHGGLVPDDRQRLADGVWAVGDCCEVWDRVLGEHWYTPLATHATKAGRVAGTNLGGGSARFAGSVGTAITRAGEADVGRTGLLPAWAAAKGMDVEVVTIDSTTTAGYMPEAEPMTVQVVGERGTGRLLGAQLVGGSGTGKRVDAAAMALWAGLTAADLAAADLAYAPPFSTTIDPVQVACRKLAEALERPSPSGRDGAARR
jgi:NADPH-dependent 2,4-dienoyl-CoA reductase/sulfur reductase-like enzyme